MPLSIKTVKAGKGTKFQVTEPDGRVLGTHETKQKAYAQIAAIEISKRRRQGKG